MYKGVESRPKACDTNIMGTVGLDIGTHLLLLSPVQSSLLVWVP